MGFCFSVVFTTLFECNKSCCIAIAGSFTDSSVRGPFSTSNNGAYPVSDGIMRLKGTNHSPFTYMCCWCPQAAVYKYSYLLMSGHREVAVRQLMFCCFSFHWPICAMYAIVFVFIHPQISMTLRISLSQNSDWLAVNVIVPTPCGISWWSINFGAISDEVRFLLGLCVWNSNSSLSRTKCVGFP